MKTVLYAYSTHERASRAFREAVHYTQHLGAVARFSDMTIELNDRRLLFVPLGSDHDRRRILGGEFIDAVIDEACDIDLAAYAKLRVRPPREETR